MAATHLEFTRDMMEGLLANTRVSGGGASAVANTQAAVDTVMQGLSAAYEHYTGTRNSDTFGDLQWLTLDTLKKSSKTTRLRPLFVESVNPAASPHQQDPVADSTLKKNLDNFRSVLCAAKKYIKSREMDDTALISHYDTAFDAFGTLCDELGVKQLESYVNGEKSTRQQENWKDWPELQRILKEPVLPYIENAVAGKNNAVNERGIPEVKKLQSYLLWALYTMIPPVRNDYPTLRFVYESEQEVAQTSKCPNYVLIPDNSDAPWVLVLNHFKNDKRTSATDFDMSQDFQLNHERTVRLVLDKDDTLERYGFDPQKLGVLLRQYRDLKLFSHRNPDQLLFFDVTRYKNKKGAQAEPVKRLQNGVTGRLTELSVRLAGVSVGSHMFRTIFLSWLGTQKPSAAERLYIAKHMCHQCKTQMTTYTKNSIPGNKRRHSSGLPISKRRAREIVDNQTVELTYEDELTPAEQAVVKAWNAEQK